MVVRYIPVGVECFDSVQRIRDKSRRFVGIHLACYESFTRLVDHIAKE